MHEAAAVAGAIAGLVVAASFRPPPREASPARITRDVLAGGAANAFTSAILNPMDVCKTRMQAEVRREGLAATHTGIRGSFATLYRSEGLRGMWMPGLTATMIREMANTGARTGLYVAVRDVMKISGGADPDGDAGLLVKAAAASATGSLGALLSNPLDVVKVRLLADSTRYSSTLAAYPRLMIDEGLAGAFRGLAPNVLRGAFISVGEVACYDHSKHVLRDLLELQEGFFLHACASLVTGVCATTVAAPFDMIKTRTMNEHVAAGTSADVLLHTLAIEGPQALFRGWVPAYFRLGPHALICFTVLEQIRRFMGLDYI
mmetsp:Transcript_40031/g.87360  ORF Transcript_40031/g.87360 Transcript_40031/m.87360 type:complete len:318 (+) Transcript_40031:42-995(+)